MLPRSSSGRISPRLRTAGRVILPSRGKSPCWVKHPRSTHSVAFIFTDLPERQAQALRLIAALMEANGKPPSQPQLAQALALKGRSAKTKPQFVLDPLKKKGYLVVREPRKRGILISDLGRQWLAEDRRRANQLEIPEAQP